MNSLDINSPRNSLSSFRVSKFKELEQKNAELLLRISDLENLCRSLQQENSFLREANQIIPQNVTNANIHPVYCTDEDELSNETDWIGQSGIHNKKKKTVSPRQLFHKHDSEAAGTPSGNSDGNYINPNQIVNEPQFEGREAITEMYEQTQTNYDQNENETDEEDETEEDITKETEWIVQKSRSNKNQNKNQPQIIPNSSAREKSQYIPRQQIYNNSASGSNQNKPSSNNEPNNREQNVYETDEDELTKETEWIVTKPRKKKSQTNTNSSSVRNQNKPPEQNKVSLARPPPIVINSTKNFTDLHNFIKSAVHGDFNIKVIHNNTYKICTFGSTEYRNLTKSLNEAKITWHSYENKQARPIRVVARNLHHTCEPTEIIKDLKDKGYKILNAFNKLQFRTKQPLDMFILSFESAENIEKIYEIKKIMNTIVKIEPMKLPKEIPQCKNCQQFNHTKNYCSKEPRCVRCAGKHLSKDCTKPQNIHPKCCNCAEHHPASYRGCIVAKELQKLRNKKVQLQRSSQQQTSRENPEEQNPPKQNQNLGPISQPVKKVPTKEKCSYSEVTRPSKVNENANQGNLLAKIIAKLDKIESANIAIHNRLIVLEQNFTN